MPCSDWRAVVAGGPDAPAVFLLEAAVGRTTLVRARVVSLPHALVAVLLEAALQRRLALVGARVVGDVDAFVSSFFQRPFFCMADAPVDRARTPTIAMEMKLTTDRRIRSLLQAKRILHLA